MNTYAKTLAFFRDAESMEIPTAGTLRAGFRDTGATTEHTLQRPGRAPWLSTAKGLTTSSATYYLVWLGCTEKKEIVSHILHSMDPDRLSDPEELARHWGTGAMATLVLDWMGRPMLNTLMPAPFVYGVPKLAAGEDLSSVMLMIEEAVEVLMPSQFGEPINAYDGSPRIEIEPTDDDDIVPESGEPLKEKGVFVHEQAADINTLLRMSKGLLSKLGMSDAIPRIRIMPKTVRFAQNAMPKKPDFSDAITHSFYFGELNYLDLAAKLSKRGRPSKLSKPLTAYLGKATSKADRVDLLHDKGALAESLRPSNLSMGRWPAPPSHSLSILQQAAVGHALRAEPLSAVNGPPGTGKTTILRDIITQTVIDRAISLSELDHPHDAFRTIKADDGDIPIAIEHIVQGTGIFVTSNNNAAVENISKELPGRHTIDKEAFPKADYLADLANDVARSFDPTSPDCWGLLSLPMGNSDNIYKTFRGLYPVKTDKELDVKSLQAPEPHGLVARLRKKGMVSDTKWINAVDDFRQARKAVSDHVEVMRHIQSNIDCGSRPNEGLMVSESAASITSGMIFPDDTFFEKKSEDQQLSSAWVTPDFEKARSNLFLEALKLHELVLQANVFVLSKFLTRARKALKGEGNFTSSQVIKIWNTLFLICPVVSTTLASVRRLPIEREWIGKVLIDEAGQATPQSIAPILQRARKAIIVGDPLQIEPVVTVPDTILAKLCQSSKINKRFAPHLASAQTVADGVMTAGAYVPTGPTSKVWTGLPLRVHRRCAEPMFSIANAIAYDGQMVQGGHLDGIDPIIGMGPSCWLNIRGIQATEKVVPEEIQMLERSLQKIKKSWPTKDGENASVCVISPFVSVERACSASAKRVFGRSATNVCPTGTVHRFQGREKDIVFLVLGSAPGEAGARSRIWASLRPNLLNVALTRARSRVFVIGNIDDWSECESFDQLAQSFWQSGAVFEMN